jgi:hypothetical protein
VRKTVNLSDWSRRYRNTSGHAFAKRLNYFSKVSALAASHEPNVPVSSGCSPQNTKTAISERSAGVILLALAQAKFLHTSAPQAVKQALPAMAAPIKPRFNVWSKFSPPQRNSKTDDIRTPWLLLSPLQLT